MVPALRVRVFVWSFLAAIAVCALGGHEVWPLTEWRLFSHVRTEVVRGWQVVAVDQAGDERVVPLDDLPMRYRGWRQVAAGLASRPEEERLAVCRTWGALAGPEAVEARIYATQDSLLQPGSFRRELRYSCDLTSEQ
jgi:hypothetical protein